MLNLIPDNTYDFNLLWKLIRKRNNWFVDLRFVAFGFLTASLLISQFILNIGFTTQQFIILFAISVSILFYNLFISSFTKSVKIVDDQNKFNPLSLALIQIGLDLFALLLLDYFTGGIESPFYVFFVFHMIIGSMIFQGKIIYRIAFVLSVCFIGLSFLEYYNLIPHYGINGIPELNFHKNFNFLLLIDATFVVLIFVSIFLAGNIARALYKREQELRITLDKLNDAEKIKMKYTMAIVHEIKSPLVAVQSILDVILGKYVGPVSKEVEEKIMQARKRTDDTFEIISDVLNISKVKLMGNINKEEVDINELIFENIVKRKPQADSKKVEVKFYDKRKEKENILGDKELIDLVLSNLLDNALKYTDNGGRVEIVMAKNNGKTSIEFCDNGLGIPEKDKQKIFNDFFRASNVKDKIRNGSGLGLSVVKQIVEQHGGSISIESPSRLSDNDGPGTSFLIQL